MYARLLIIVAALALSTIAAAEPKVYRGQFCWGFETSSFYPDGQDENWWLSASNDDAARELMDAIEAARDKDVPPLMKWTTIVVEVEGRLSEPGSYGHLGGYYRELLVDRVISTRPLRPGEVARRDIPWKPD